MKNNSSIVYLIGAGPGDPDLLTVKALRLIQQADIVVYDRLVSSEIMQQVPNGTQLIYVGKASGQHHMNQQEINQLLVNLAQARHSQKPRNIVRLKGGDPFIFGRGSEEALALVEQGIRFEYVPGITAAAACSAYAGIPLTHRGVAKSVRLITGHCRDNQPLELNWKSLADKETTLVFYMGLSTVEQLSRELMAAGLAPSTPAAVVENGTTQMQRRCLSTLNNLAEQVKLQQIRSPALIIIGDVVNFADTLDWFTPEMQSDDVYSQPAES